MNDRELLELAAKAAGIGPILCYESRRNCLRIGNREAYWLWRPLTDDGAALRLAVNLHMNIEITDSDVYACANFNCSEPAKPNANTATRRAIVRAAVEIGRAMP